MNAMPRRVSPWKILGIVGAIVVIFAVSLWLWVQSSIDRKWVAMEHSVAQLMAEARLRDSKRPIIQGPALAGNAWDDYQTATNDFRRLASSFPLHWFGMYLEGNLVAEPKKVSATLDLLEPVFERLRSGSHRAECQKPYDWAKPDSIPSESLVSQWLAAAAACKARELAESSNSREAVELLLATGQFAHDVGVNGFLITEAVGMSCYAYSLDEIHRLLVAGKFSHEQLLQLDAGLAILDQSFLQRGPSLRNNLLMDGDAMIRGVYFTETTYRSAPNPKEYKPTWRQLFSTRLLEAEAFVKAEKWSKRMTNATTLSWAEELREWAEISGEAASSGNALAARNVKQYGPSGNRRARLTQLRLIRMAAQYMASGEVPEIDDPLGTSLRHRLIGNKLQVWSVGMDGVDDDGSGDWSLKGKDIVLEVER